MRKYFGTDGIRRIANSELTPELVYKVAKAGAYVLSKHTEHTPTIFIGRDTRISGTLIEAAMTAGFLSYGANVKQLGVIPTPGVAYLTKRYKADASVVISASHNTFEFNGIKYFSNKGMKIPDALEEEIEEVMDSGKLDELSAVSEKIGVSEDIADTTIPLGTSFHKDGSIIGSVFKIMFLVYLFGMDVSIIKVLGVSLLATILITAVPIGGGTISEMLIISLMGFPIASLPILTIIATIIDAPATVLNVVGDSASSMLVAKIVDGKNWIIKKSS